MVYVEHEASNGGIWKGFYSLFPCGSFPSSVEVRLPLSEPAAGFPPEVRFVEGLDRDSRVNLRRKSEEELYFRHQAPTLNELTQRPGKLAEFTTGQTMAT